MHFLNYTLLLILALVVLESCYCMEINQISNDSSLAQLKIPNRKPEKIVGGEEARQHEFPWLIRIQRKTSKGLLCGGTIIDYNLVMTAAHCFGDPDKDAKTYEILAGAHDMNSKEDMRQIRNIKRINKHKEYNGGTFQNDICILVLESSLNWTPAVKPALLANESSTIPSNATTAGWGVDEQDQPVSLLRKVSVPIVDNWNCSLSYNSKGYKITDSMICAGSSGKDSCRGDSGGGLICSSEENTFICGIVSFGAGCGEPQFPGVYTRVGSFSKWIAENGSGKSVSLVPMIILLAAFTVLSTFIITQN